MPANSFLHEHSQFKELIQILSEELSIAPLLIEKDYWIMHCLWGLQKNFHFELKGGTSLSKGHKIIDRFSEDIDIRIEPPTGMVVNFGDKYKKPADIKSRQDFFKWIEKSISIPDIISVVRDPEFEDSKSRNAAIRLHYESHFTSIRDVKEGVLLEVGSDDTTPNDQITISSWAIDRALKQNIQLNDNRAINVKCYWPEYTFVEKLQTVSTKFRRQQESGDFSRNFMRHYYDIHQLLNEPRVQKYIGTEGYKKRKKDRFRDRDNLNIAENDAFLLRDEKTRKLYEREYKKTSTLYYKGQIPFADILKRIQENLDRL